MTGIKNYIGWLTLLPATLAAAANVAPGKTEPDPIPAWRTAAARVLVARDDAEALAAAAALTFAGPASRSKAEAARAAVAALDIAVKASERAPEDPALSWLHLQLCAAVPACDIRDAATTMRWVAAQNGAAWLPTLAEAQRDKDSMQMDRALAAMARAGRFDLYGNRIAVLTYDALKRSRAAFPRKYLPSDLTRLNEAMDIAAATVMPSFSALINACRDTTAAERYESCVQVSRTMQKADVVLAQLVGFALEKRLDPSESRSRTIAERRRLLEYRASMANISDTPLLPWLRNARARTRLARMRALPREEDVYVALLRDHGIPLEPPEDRR